MNQGLEQKSLLIPAFGYEKHRIRGESIKAPAKLACEEERERNRGMRESEREREMRGERGVAVTENRVACYHLFSENDLIHV